MMILIGIKELHLLPQRTSNLLKKNFWTYKTKNTGLIPCSWVGSQDVK